MCDTLLDLGYLFIGLFACEKRHDVSTSVMEMERAGVACFSSSFYKNSPRHSLTAATWTNWMMNCAVQTTAKSWWNRHCPRSWPRNENQDLRRDTGAGNEKSWKRAACISLGQDRRRCKD